MFLFLKARLLRKQTLSLLATFVVLAASSLTYAQRRPATPRVESLAMSERQPHAKDPAVIWYDNFDDPARQRLYPEGSGQLTSAERFGVDGSSLRMRYRKGARGDGGRKIFFGDSPVFANKAVRRGETFTDVYWRIYVKHQRGWQGGGPAKLSRATSLVPPGWSQAMIAHVWSSGQTLTLDPASGVRGDRVVTHRYNDFKNLRWLGNKPTARLPIHSTEESGWWVCVETRVKLNTPGKKDGLNQLWIDGQLEAERKNLDWRGSYTKYGVNAVFLEAYWNQGSPVDQSRWIDNFVVSTKPIGPVVCPRNVTVIKTPYEGPGKQAAWQLEISSDRSDRSVVWRSSLLTSPDRVQVDSTNGRFVGSLAGADALAANTVYTARVRQRGETTEWSDWSPWRQPFRTVAETP